ncbi:MAG TPA: outer membrane lipoprotein chaperone LolA [Azoarcus sp.]|nr:outer membrane lipoprotein chaperone LolA [Azoarcus sp.]
MLIHFLCRVAAVFLVAFPVLAQADNGVTQLERFIEQAARAEGRFEQVVTSQSGEGVQTSSGTFVFERPGKFRWEYETPYPQLLVSDGERFWSWDPDLNQATMQPLGDALGNTPIAILAGDGALENNFTLIPEGSLEGQAWVRAEPIDKEGPFAQVRIGLADNRLRQMEMEDHFGQRTLIEFTELTLGQAREPSTFRFDPPEGADVLGR